MKNAPDGSYLHQNLSWLAFNRRVLSEANNSGVLPLDRLRFLAVSAINLDEFISRNLGPLLWADSSVTAGLSEMTPTEELAEVFSQVGEIVDAQYECFLSDLEPVLAEKNLRRLAPSELNEEQSAYVDNLFHNELYPLLTPIAVAQNERLPQLLSKTLNLGMRLRSLEDKTAKERLAVIPLGRIENRMITLPGERGYSYMLIEDALGMYLDSFFPADEVIEWCPFRVVSATSGKDRGDGSTAADGLRWVRLDVDLRASDKFVQLIGGEESLDERAVFRLIGPLDLSAMMRLVDLSGFEELTEESWLPQMSPKVDPTVGMFETIADHDVLLYHPYESFDPVVRLMDEAAADPDVLAIKQIMHPSSRHQAIINALKKASRNGKYVTVVIDTRRRAGEKFRSAWIDELEQEEVQVVSAAHSHSTSGKMSIIVRRESQGIVKYVYFGTGNHSEYKAEVYSDISLMSCHDDLTTDAVAFFNATAGGSFPEHYHKLESAPRQIRESLLGLIDGEIQRKLGGQEAGITAKLNALSDYAIIDELYRASQAGVPVRLNIRGSCCLRPGVPGVSDQITVVSVVDRILEHSRVIHFHHGGDDCVWISSADWTADYFDRSVEWMAPVEDEQCRLRLLEILEAYFRDDTKSWELQPNGSYKRKKKAGKRRFRSQFEIYQRTCEEMTRAESSRRTMFEPHRAPSSDF